MLGDRYSNRILVRSLHREKQRWNRSAVSGLFVSGSRLILLDGKIRIPVKRTLRWSFILRGLGWRNARRVFRLPILTTLRWRSLFRFWSSPPSFLIVVRMFARRSVIAMDRRWSRSLR